MTTFLETTVDKFTFRVADDRLYIADGLWVQPLEVARPTRVRIGVTDFVQQKSGDVAFVSVRPPGAKLEAGEELAKIETIKIDLELASPVGGTVLEANAALETAPELVNQDPYGAGWLAVLEVPDWDGAKKNLLEPRAYFEEMKRQAQEEVAK